MDFIRQLLIYGVFGAASRLAAVLLVPLYTRTLSMEQYGNLELLLAIHALFVLVAGLQSESAVARDYFNAEKANAGASLLWGSLWVSLGGTGLVIAACGLLWVMGVSLGTDDGVALLLLFALTLPAQLLGIQLVILRFKGASFRFAATSFLDLLLCAGLSVYFIMFLHMDLRGALLGLLLSKVICVGLSWQHTFGKPPIRGTVAGMMRGILQYGVPALPAALIGWVQNAGSRLILAISLTLSDVAIAGVAIKVAAIYAFLVQSFRLAWEPYSMARLDGDESQSGFFNQILQWYVLAMFLAAGVGVLFTPVVMRILAPPEYAAGGDVAGFFILGQFWVGLATVLVVGIHGARKTWLLLPAYGFGAALNCLLLVILAPMLGALSAGVAFLAGSMVTAILACWYSNRYFNVGFDMRLLVFVALATLIFGVGARAILSGGGGGLWGQLTANGATLLLLLALLIMVVRMSFQQGRATQMWCELRLLVLRRRVSP